VFQSSRRPQSPWISSRSGNECELMIAVSDGGFLASWIFRPQHGTLTTYFATLNCPAFSGSSAFRATVRPIGTKSRRCHEDTISSLVARVFSRDAASIESHPLGLKN
jgi:hypothetical protein